MTCLACDTKPTLETQLGQLLLAARQHPAGSFQRQRYLNRLISLMQKSGKIWRGGGGLDGDRYEEALQKTWLYFCHNLDRYDPDRANVLTWFNEYLRYRIHDSRIEQQRHNSRVQTTHPLQDESSPDLWELLPAAPDIPPILDDIQDWLEADMPHLQGIHLRNRPEVNCWVLLQRRLPPEMPWKDLSAELGVPVPTLSNFYQQKCLPKLLEFGQRQGYLDRTPNAEVV